MVAQHAHGRQVVSGLDHHGHFTEGHGQVLKIRSKRITQGGFESFQFCRHTALLARDGVGALDLVLQLDDAVQQRLAVGGQPGT
jgi:hypothetical protein